MEHRSKIVLAELAGAAEAEARDIAEAELNEEKKSLKGASGLWKKFGKHNLWREVTLQKRRSEIEGDIRKTGRVMRDSKGGETPETQEADRKIKEGVVDRFLQEFDEVIHTDAFESRNNLGETGVEGELKQKIKDLVKRGLQKNTTGGYELDLLGEEYLEERNRLLTEFAPHHATQVEEDLKAARADAETNNDKAEMARIDRELERVGVERIEKGKIYADNIKKVIEQFRGQVEAGESADALTQDLEVVVGRAKIGARTEEEYSKLDKYIRKAQALPLGRFVNKTTIAAALSVVYSGAVLMGKSATRSLGTAVGGLAGATAIGGVFGYKQEVARLAADKRQHERERTKGAALVMGGDKNRLEMESVSNEKQNAIKLHADLEAALYHRGPDGVREVRDLSVQEFADAMEALAEIDQRISVSNKHGVDRIAYQSVETLEQERTQLDISRAMAKRDLRKVFEEKKYVEYQYEGASFDSARAEVNDAVRERLLKGAGGLEEREKLFKKMQHSKAWDRAKTGMMVGLGLGITLQEIGALWRGDGSGFFGEKLVVPEGHEKHLTMLGGARQALRDWWNGTEVPHIPNGNSHIEHITDATNFKLPEGVSLHKNPDGTIDILQGGKPFAEHLSLNENGTLTEDAKHLLQLKGVDTHTLTVPVAQNIVHKVGEHVPGNSITAAPGAVGKAVEFTPKQIAESPASGFHAVHRLAWHKGANEARLHWGGTHSTGLKDGMVVYSVRGMKGHAADLVKDGKMKMLFSLSRDSQTHVMEVDVDAHGNAIIDPTTNLGKMMFQVENGHVRLLAKYAEVAEVTGVKNGVEQVKLFATDVGRGAHSVSIPVPGVPEVPHAPGSIVPIPSTPGKEVIKEYVERKVIENRIVSLTNFPAQAGKAGDWDVELPFIPPNVAVFLDREALEPVQLRTATRDSFGTRTEARRPWEVAPVAPPVPPVTPPGSGPAPTPVPPPALLPGFKPRESGVSMITVSDAEEAELLAGRPKGPELLKVEAAADVRRQSKIVGVIATENYASLRDHEVPVSDAQVEDFFQKVTTGEINDARFTGFLEHMSPGKGWEEKVNREMESSRGFFTMFTVLYFNATGEKLGAQPNAEHFAKLRESCKTPIQYEALLPGINETVRSMYKEEFKTFAKLFYGRQYEYWEQIQLLKADAKTWAESNRDSLDEADNEDKNSVSAPEAIAEEKKEVADKEKDKKPLSRKEAQANLERRLRETLYSKDFNAEELRSHLLPEFQANKDLVLSGNDSAFLAAYLEKQDPSYLEKLNEVAGQFQLSRSGHRDTTKLLWPVVLRAGDTLEGKYPDIDFMKEKKFVELFILDTRPEAERTGYEDRIKTIGEEANQYAFHYAAFDAGTMSSKDLQKMSTDALLAWKQQIGDFPESVGIVSLEDGIPMGRINKNYFLHAKEMLDGNPNIDMIAGEWNFTKSAYGKTPLIGALNRIHAHMETSLRNRGLRSPEFTARNGIVRTGVYAAAGGYDAKSGPMDLELGWRLKEGRGYQPKRIVYAGGQRGLWTKSNPGRRGKEDLFMDFLFENKTDDISPAELQQKVQSMYNSLKADWGVTEPGALISERALNQDFISNLEAAGINSTFADGKITVRLDSPLLIGEEVDTRPLPPRAAPWVEPAPAPEPIPPAATNPFVTTDWEKGGGEPDPDGERLMTPQEMLQNAEGNFIDDAKRKGWGPTRDALAKTIAEAYPDVLPRVRMSMVLDSLNRLREEELNTRARELFSEIQARGERTSLAGTRQAAEAENTPLKVIQESTRAEVQKLEVEEKKKEAAEKAAKEKSAEIPEYAEGDLDEEREVVHNLVEELISKNEPWKDIISKVQVFLETELPGASNREYARILYPVVHEYWSLEMEGTKKRFMKMRKDPIEAGRSARDAQTDLKKAIQKIAQELTAAEVQELETIAKKP